MSSASEVQDSLEKMQNALDGFDSLIIDEAMEQLSRLVVPDGALH